MSGPFFRSLAQDASSRYDRGDRFARHFAFGKLTRDPVFEQLLARGLLPPRARLLDLGCGQGVLAALLLAADSRHAQGEWPAEWPAPPGFRTFRGIDLMPKEIARATRAGAGRADFVAGDIRETPFGEADAVVILDVLHYIDEAAQAAVLLRVREALAAGGVLLLRVGDASGTWRFRATVAVDRIVMALRGHRLARLYCKPLARWIAELAALGFRVEATPMSGGTPFANVLLVARYDAASGAREEDPKR